MWLLEWLVLLPTAGACEGEVSAAQLQGSVEAFEHAWAAWAGALDEAQAKLTAEAMEVRWQSLTAELACAAPLMPELAARVHVAAGLRASGEGGAVQAFGAARRAWSEAACPEVVREASARVCGQFIFPQASVVYRPACAGDLRPVGEALRVDGTLAGEVPQNLPSLVQLPERGTVLLGVGEPLPEGWCAAPPPPEPLEPQPARRRTATAYWAAGGAALGAGVLTMGLSGVLVYNPTRCGPGVWDGEACERENEGYLDLPANERVRKALIGVGAGLSAVGVGVLAGGVVLTVRPDGGEVRLWWPLR